MLETPSAWLVQQPLHIALVAAAHLALWILCRSTVLRTVPKSNVLWLPAILWLAYALWEWLVLVKTPEANIRVPRLVVGRTRQRPAVSPGRPMLSIGWRRSCMPSESGRTTAWPR
jgi:hypothetical protein